MFSCFASDPHELDGKRTLSRRTPLDEKKDGLRPRAVLVYATGMPRNLEQERQQLSPVDHSAILTCINPKAFWFQAPGLQPGALRASLQKLLADYPLLSGRLGTDGGPGGLGPLRKRLAVHISVCNAGAEFSETADPLQRSMQDFPLGAMARTGFTHMSAQPTLPEFFAPVDIKGLLSGEEPLLKVRLTRLTCGGCILALTLSHAVLDGHSAAMFLNDWAAAYREEQAASEAATDAAAAAAFSAALASQPLEHRVRPATPPVAPPSSPVSPGHAHRTGGQNPAARPLPAGKLAVLPPAQPAASEAEHPLERRRPPPLMDRGALLPGASRQHGQDKQGALKSSASQLQLTASSTAAGAGGALAMTASTGAPAVLEQVQHGKGAGGGGAVAEEPGSPTLRSLALQRVPAPGWGAALKRFGALVAAVREQDQQWPGFRNDLSSLVVHLPPAEVAQLKALASCPPQGSSAPAAAISTNDAVAGLVWTLMCHVRGRPLPGSAPPSCPNSMALAVDLRRNGLKGELPLNLFANATWCLHVPNSTGEAGADSPRSAAPAPGGAPDGEREVLLRALRAGAAKVRSSLTEFRSQAPASGWQVVDLAAHQCRAPFSAQLQLACNVMMGQDAMLSSWQFPYWDADFGAGGPLRYMGALHPTPPWSAAVMAGHPSHGGLYLFLVVPSAARTAVRGSTVLSTLAPGARFAG